MKILINLVICIVIMLPCIEAQETVKNEEQKVDSLLIEIRFPISKENIWNEVELKRIGQNRNSRKLYSRKLKIDSLSKFRVIEGEYLLNIWFDTTIIVYFQDTLRVEKNGLNKFDYTLADLKKRKPKNLLSNLDNEKTILVYRDNNSWFQRKDSLLLHEDNKGNLILEWYYERKPDKSRKFYKKIQLTNQLYEELVDIENKLKYPQGLQRILISSCSQYDGLDWYMEIQRGKFKKIYFSEKCGNDKWRAIRKKVIGISE